MNPNTPIPLEVVLSTIKTQASKVTDDEEKMYLYNFVTDLGTNIRNHVKEFDVEQFRQQCGIPVNWKSIAA